MASYPTEPSFNTVHDIVPNFALTPDILSARSGNWSDTATWIGGVVPGAGDIAGIQTTHEVIYDVDSTVELEAVGVAGTLTFRTDADTQLWVQHLITYLGSTLRVGNAANPIGSAFTAEIVFTDVALDTGTVESPGTDPFQFGNGLIAFGDVQMHGQMKQRFTRPNAAMAATSTAVPAGTNWASGDSVFISDTRHRDDGPFDRYEYRTLSAADTISSGLTYDHPIALNADTTPARSGALCAHVANLTCNVILRSENPAGTRGHMMFTGNVANGNGTPDLRYVLVKDMGRTLNDVLDVTTGTPSVPTHIGTNQIGRYPVHMHHKGACSFVLEGLVVHQSKKWPLTVHGTQGGRVSDCVCIDGTGAGIVTEDATVQGTLFEDNFCAVIDGTGQLANDDSPSLGSGRHGAGYWLKGTRVDFLRNAAANNKLYGCIAHGDSVHGLTNFTDSEFYSCPNGFAPVDIGGSFFGDIDYPTLGDPSYIDGMTCWHITNYGVFGYASAHVYFTDYYYRGDKSIIAGTGPLNAAFWWGDYNGVDMSLVGADIEGSPIGIRAPLRCNVSNLGTGIQQAPTPTYLTNLSIKAFWCIRIDTPAGPGGGGGHRISGRELHIGNAVCSLLPGRGDLTPYLISTWYRGYDTVTDGTGVNLMALDQTFVTDWQGVVGDDFQLFYDEQAAATVVPTGNVPIGFIASPEAGLTNQQLHDKYEPYPLDPDDFPTVKADNPNPATPGLCIAGELLPAGTTTRADIKGPILEM